MQMINICVCNTYADAGDMDMPDLSSVLSFSAEIRKKAEPETEFSVDSYVFLFDISVIEEFVRSG